MPTVWIALWFCFISARACEMPMSVLSAEYFSQAECEDAVRSWRRNHPHGADGECQRQREWDTTWGRTR